MPWDKRFSLIEQIADWVVRVRATDIPERVKSEARLQRLSTIAAIAASRRHMIGQKILAGLGSCWFSPGKCTRSFRPGYNSYMKSTQRRFINRREYRV